MCKISSPFSNNAARSYERREGASEGNWVPNTDVYLNDDGLVIKVELAGMRREDLQITIEGNSLRIRGHRGDGCRSANAQFLVMEISYGEFESVIELPEGYDLGQAKAAYQNGFLRIDVPKLVKPAKKSREVAIKSGPE